MYYPVSRKKLYWRLSYFYIILMIYLILLNLKSEYVYADDTLLYNKIHNINDCLQLRSDISILEEWAKTLQMDFNPST